MFSPPPNNVWSALRQVSTLPHRESNGKILLFINVGQLCTWSSDPTSGCYNSNTKTYNLQP